MSNQTQNDKFQDVSKGLRALAHRALFLADKVDDLHDLATRGRGCACVQGIPPLPTSEERYPACTRGGRAVIIGRKKLNAGITITRGPRYLSLFPATFLEDHEFVRWWSTWEQHRRESHHSLSSSTAQTQADKLKKIGPRRAAEALQTCVEKGWWGLDWGIKRSSAVLGPAPKATPVVSPAHHKIAVILRKVFTIARRDPPPVDHTIAAADALITWWRALPGATTCSRPTDGPRYFLTSPGDVARRYVDFLEKQGERFINHNILNLEQWQWKEFIANLERQMDTNLKTGRRLHA